MNLMPSNELTSTSDSLVCVFMVIVSIITTPSDPYYLSLMWMYLDTLRV
jgi:hypothetical protein